VRPSVYRPKTKGGTLQVCKDRGIGVALGHRACYITLCAKCRSGWCALPVLASSKVGEGIGLLSRGRSGRSRVCEEAEEARALEGALCVARARWKE